MEWLNLYLLGSVILVAVVCVVLATLKWFVVNDVLSMARSISCWSESDGGNAAMA
jgi:hypothetical protein